MKNIVVIDSYDSFTYNLVHYFEALDCDVTVFRNDEITINKLIKFDGIVLSPGPGIPSEAGLVKQIIKKYADKKPILGVCLGHQAICEVFGGEIVNLDTVFHGVSTQVSIVVDDEPIFNGIPEVFNVGRYHSWVVSKQLPNNLEATSFSEDGQIMSVRHRLYNVKGVQFHPESILTPHGKQILKNWISNK